MDGYVQTLKTLADQTRLTIFKLVVAEELCGCELQELLQVSQPAISQHIAKLRQAGLVKERRSGMWTYYRGDLEQVKAQLGEFLSFLAADPKTLPQLADVMARRQRLDRAELCADRKGERQQ